MARRTRGSLSSSLAFFAEAGSVRIVEVKARRRRRYKRRVSLRRRNAEIGDPGAPRRAGRISGTPGVVRGRQENLGPSTALGTPRPARPAKIAKLEHSARQRYSRRTGPSPRRSSDNRLRKKARKKFSLETSLTLAIMRLIECDGCSR